MTPIECVAAILVSSSTTNPYTPTFPGGIIAWIICYKQRRSQIGGWLLFYYWQLYGGILLTLLFFVMAFQSYVPESFQNADIYHLFLLSAVPAIILYAVQVAIGTMLLSVRTWDMLRLLRWVMIANVIWDAVSLVIDSQNFPESLGFEIYTDLMSIIWLIYFFVSKRVKHVFKTYDWDVAVETIHPDPDKVTIT